MNEHIDPEVLGYCPRCLAEDIEASDAEQASSSAATADGA